MKFSSLCFICFFFVYVALFMNNENRAERTEPKLTVMLPQPIYEMMGGYTRQLLAEFLYIKTVVFLGSPFLPDVELYKKNLYQYFVTIQALHPHLLDTYYLSESSLSWVSQLDAKLINVIMSIGIEKKAYEWRIYFFKGFNEFYYLKNSMKASHTLFSSINSYDAPTWLQSLAAVLAVKEGEIKTALLWLKIMSETEENAEQLKRYHRDIDTFEKALVVESALQSYYKKHHAWPSVLQDLIPDFLVKLPILKGGGYELSYKQNKLHLFRSK